VIHWLRVCRPNCCLHCETGDLRRLRFMANFSGYFLYLFIAFYTVMVNKDFQHFCSIPPIRTNPWTRKITPTSSRDGWSRSRAIWPCNTQQVVMPSRRDELLDGWPLVHSAVARRGGTYGAVCDQISIGALFQSNPQSARRSSRNQNASRESRIIHSHSPVFYWSPYFTSFWPTPLPNPSPTTIIHSHSPDFYWSR